MHGLSVCDPAYAVLYAQVSHQFPNAAKPLALPNFGQATTTITNQTPAPQPMTNSYSPHPSQNHGLSNKAASFFSKTARTDGCTFCTLQGHLIKRCPATEEYVCTSCATIRDGRIAFGNGQPIPNDRSGCGLKFTINLWVGAGSQLGESSPTISIQTPGAAALSCSLPPHTAFSFEVVQYSADSDDESDIDLPFPDTDLYDLQEVLWLPKKNNGPEPQNFLKPPHPLLHSQCQHQHHPLSLCQYQSHQSTQQPHQSLSSQPQDCHIHWEQTDHHNSNIRPALKTKSSQMNSSPCYLKVNYPTQPQLTFSLPVHQCKKHSLTDYTPNVLKLEPLKSSGTNMTPS
jgi:hypothetical protein